jgi:KAT8 regulatory NSL complex subunit 2
MKNQSKMDETKCNYSNFSCSLPCVFKYKFCIKHILQDPNAPYKPCNYVYASSGKSCGHPRLVDEKIDGE